MKILITGSRETGDKRFPIEKIVEVFKKFPPDTIIIHGACKGVDKAAGIIAEQFGFEVREYPAKWSIFGKKAGMIRNREMYDIEQPDVVIAFHSNILKSKGTAGMMRYAESKGCKVLLFT